MRIVTALGCAVCLAVTGGCKEDEMNMLTGARVNIRLECDDGRKASFALKPWSVKPATRAEAIVWHLVGGSDVDSVTISPADTDWPFAYNPIVAKPGRPGRGSDPQGPARTVKYKVTGICDRGNNVKDTIVVDPDMIIPN